MTLKLSKRVQLLQGFIYVFLVGCFDNGFFFLDKKMNVCTKTCLTLTIVFF